MTTSPRDFTTPGKLTYYLYIQSSEGRASSTADKGPSCSYYFHCYYCYCCAAHYY